LHELEYKLREKKYLSERITPEQIAELISILLENAEILPRIAEELPSISRDHKDDYLLAYAWIGQADFLVTGDRDLLILGQLVLQRRLFMVRLPPCWH
jgi:putative PIN family toxin of toxin-antitoxin system